MRQTSYMVQVIFTNDAVVACSCECKAGDTTDGKVLCVHTLCSILLLNILLLDGLAEHILLHLAAEWPDFSNLLHNEVEAKRYLLPLINASGRIEVIEGEASIEDLLSHFAG